MGSVVARKLVFRLGEIGFSLDLSFVVEICEQVADLLDTQYADPSVGIVGALEFRNASLPAIDPALGFALTSSGPLSGKLALILTGPEGNWALLVDQIDGISPADKFQPLEMSPLLRSTTSNYYSQVQLLEDEPLVCFVPEIFYGAPGPAA